MTEEKQPFKQEDPVEIPRLFEQPPDAISFYADQGRIFNTGNEVVIQFYETIPGPPGGDGNIKNVRTRLRVTVFLSIPHAHNIGKLLVEKTEEAKK